jgi:malate dehydrogenase (oxaloacetate-decarboxylating)(NADP+)
MPQQDTVFMCDTQATSNPSPQALADMTLLAAEQIKRFGITPQVALMSHSNYGSADTASANKMRDTLALLQKADPDLIVDGEMQGDAAFNESIRNRLNPKSTLEGAANLLVMPSLDSANISYNLLKTMGAATSIGPILLGAAKPVHIVTTSVTSRGIVNISALAVVDAQG